MQIMLSLSYKIGEGGQGGPRQEHMKEGRTDFGIQAELT